jgi:hypothetical protein
MIFLKELAEGVDPLPEPYTNDDRPFVLKAVEHSSTKPDQEAGSSGQSTPTRSRGRFLSKPTRSNRPKKT